MPTAFTHQLIAEDARPPEVTDELFADYSFGAQGPDPLFFYRFIRMAGRNVGSMLHRKDVAATFDALVRHVRTHSRALGFALGYVTHYAADSTFHPYVYSYVHAHGKTKLERDTLHTQMESDFDSRFLADRGVEVCDYRLPYSRRDLDYDVIADATEAIAEEQGIVMDRRAIGRATNAWFRYLRFTTDSHYRKGRFWRSVGRFSKQFRRLGSMFRRTDIEEAYLNASGEEWSYHDTPTLISHDDAFALYDKAVAKAKELIAAFLTAVRTGEDLDPTIFERNFDGYL